MSAERSSATDEAAELDELAPALDFDRVPNGEPVYDPAAGTGAADLLDGPATYDPAAPLAEVAPRTRRTNGTRRGAGGRGAAGNGRAATRAKKGEKRDRDPLEEVSDPTPVEEEPSGGPVADGSDRGAEPALDPAPGAQTEPTGMSDLDLLGEPAPADVAGSSSLVTEDDAVVDRGRPDSVQPVPDPPIVAAAAASIVPPMTAEPVVDEASAEPVPPQAPERFVPRSAAEDAPASVVGDPAPPDPQAEDLPAPPPRPDTPEPAAGDVSVQPASMWAESGAQGSPSEPHLRGGGAGTDGSEAGQGWLHAPEPVDVPAPGDVPTVEAPPSGGSALPGFVPESAQQSWGSDVTVSVAAPPVPSPPLVAPPAVGADVAPVSAVPADVLAGEATASEAGGRIRRRRMIRSRKVRRVIRHVDPWSVLTFSVIFHLCLFSALLLAGALVWSAAAASGTIENVESFVRDLGDYDTWEIQGDAVLRAGVIIAGMMTLASTVLVVLLTVVFNLISDLIGGIRVTVIEEEVHRVPVPRRK